MTTLTAHADRTVGQGGSPGARSSATRSRWSLLAFFGLFGVGSALWLSRLPAVEERLGIGAARLGALLVVGAVGSLATVLVAGALVTRFGNRRSLVGATAIKTVAMLVMAGGLAARSVPLLAVGLLLNGVAGALTNVPINTSAAVVERALGRSVMSQFHAAFSVGMVAGSALGALAARLGVSVAAQLVVSAALIGAARLWLVPTSTALSPHPPRTGRRARARAEAARAEAARTAALTTDLGPEPTAAPVTTPSGTAPSGTTPSGTSTPGPDDAPRPARGTNLRAAAGAWREPRTLLIGLVCFAAALSEGSASNWLPIAVGQGFGKDEATSALVLTTFTGAMMIVRVLGPRLIDRLGRTRTLVAAGTLASLGLLAFGLAPAFGLAWAGVALWGAGAALAVPVALTAAADDPAHAAVRVSVVTTFSSVAQLTAPPLLGLLVDSLGGRRTLLLIVVAMVMSICASPAVRPVGQTRRARGETIDAPAAHPQHREH